METETFYINIDADNIGLEGNTPLNNFRIQNKNNSNGDIRAQSQPQANKGEGHAGVDTGQPRATPPRNDIYSDQASTTITSDPGVSDRVTTTDQGDMVEGVAWYNPSRLSADFAKNFIDNLRVTDISGRAKQFILNRYITLFNKYRKKHRLSRCINNISRIIVTVGGICIPALLTMDEGVKERPKTSQAVYYTTFTLAVFISIVNGLAELSQISKRFYADATTHQQLEHEGWSFLLLRGHYRKYSSHRACWQAFLYRIDKIHQSAIQSGLLLYRQQESDMKHRASNTLDHSRQRDNPGYIDNTNEDSSSPPGEIGPNSDQSSYENRMLREVLHPISDEPNRTGAASTHPTIIINA